MRRGAGPARPRDLDRLLAVVGEPLDVTEYVAADLVAERLLGCACLVCPDDDRHRQRAYELVAENIVALAGWRDDDDVGLRLLRMAARIKPGVFQAIVVTRDQNGILARALEQQILHHDMLARDAHLRAAGEDHAMPRCGAHHDGFFRVAAHAGADVDHEVAIGAGAEHNL